MPIMLDPPLDQEYIDRALGGRPMHETFVFFAAANEDFIDIFFI